MMVSLNQIRLSGSFLMIIVVMLSPELVASQLQRQSLSSASTNNQPEIPEQQSRRFVFPGSELFRRGQKSVTTQKPISSGNGQGRESDNKKMAANQGGQSNKDEDLVNNELTIGSVARTKKGGDRTNASVTWQMFDLASANLYPLGDINRELPDTMSGVKFYCKNRDNWFNIVEQWIEKRFSDEIPNAKNSISNSVSYFYLRSIRAKNDEFCQDRNTMQDFIDNATMVNLFTKKLWQVRKEYANLMTKSFLQFDKIDYRFICCGYYIYEKKTSDSVDKRVRAWLRDYIFAYHTSQLEFHCGPISKNSTHCNTFGVDDEYPSRRFKRPPFVSLQHPQLELLIKDFLAKGQVKSLSAIAKASNVKDPIAMPGGSDDVKFDNEFINQKQAEDDVFDKSEELQAKEEWKKSRFINGQKACYEEARDSDKD